MDFRIADTFTDSMAKLNGDVRSATENTLLALIDYLPGEAAEARLGRKTRLPEAKRQVLWPIFEEVRANLAARNLITESAMFARLADEFANGRSAPFDFAVVDEAQDVGAPQMCFLAALGVDIRGRSRTLRVNYRTSHQIRMQADRLLGPAVTDVDGISED